jgi:hypothetical protein
MHSCCPAFLGSANTKHPQDQADAPQGDPVAISTRLQACQTHDTCQLAATGALPPSSCNEHCLSGHHLISVVSIRSPSNDCPSIPRAPALRVSHRPTTLSHLHQKHWWLWTNNCPQTLLACYTTCILLLSVSSPSCCLAAADGLSYMQLELSDTRLHPFADRNVLHPSCSCGRGVTILTHMCDHAVLCRGKAVTQGVSGVTNPRGFQPR